MSLAIVHPEQMEPDGERVTWTGRAGALAPGGLECVGSRPQDFKAEIRLVPASHLTEGDPRSVEVK